MPANEIKLYAVTTQCHESTLGEVACDGLMSHFKASEGPDVMVITCQQIDFERQIQEFNQRIAKTPDIKLLSSNLMATKSKATGYATFVIYRPSRIQHASFLDMDAQEIRGGFMGKRWEKGCSANTLSISHGEHLFQIQTLSVQLNPLSWHNILQKISKRLDSFEDLAKLIPDVQLVGFDPESALHGHTLILKNNTESSLTDVRTQDVAEIKLHPVSDFNKIQHHLASMLIDIAPKLAKEIMTLDDSEPHKTMLLALHQHYLSPNGALFTLERKEHSKTLQQFLIEELNRQAQAIRKVFDPRMFLGFKHKYVIPMKRFDDALRDFSNLQNQERFERLKEALNGLLRTTSDPHKKDALAAFHSFLNVTLNPSTSKRILPKPLSGALDIEVARELAKIFKEPADKPGSATNEESPRL